MNMWNLFISSFRVFCSKKILIILLLRFLVGIIFDLNFGLSFDNKITRSSLLSCSICDYIFTVIALLVINHQKINISNLISIKKSLFNSLLLFLGLVIIWVILFMSIVTAGNSFALWLSIIFTIILSILSIDLGVAINYTLLDNVPVKESIKLSMSIISGYRIGLMLTIFISGLFFSSISMFSIFVFDISDIHTGLIKTLKYIVTHGMDIFIRLYHISFFYHFWKNRNNIYKLNPTTKNALTGSGVGSGLNGIFSKKQDLE